MATWIFTGSIHLDGVLFVITADTEADAIAKANAGEYDEWDTSGASTRDLTIYPKSGEQQ